MLSAQINTECMVQFIDAELVQQALGFIKIPNQRQESSSEYVYSTFI